MEIPVLIHEVPGKGFVATAPALGWSAEGATADEAVANLKSDATQRLSACSQTVMLELPNGRPTSDPLAGLRAKGMLIEAPKGDHPLLKWAGTLDPNDPMVQEWRKAVEEYRRQIDSDPDVY